MSGLCRVCGAQLSQSFCDLGTSPLSNAYLTEEDIARGAERYYPLHAFVCGVCHLVQLEPLQAPEEIFSDYLYFSSYSDSWVQHAKSYADRMCDMLSLDERSLVVEVASNDGYLLQHFVERRIPVLGVEPAANVAEVARSKGVRTESTFFGEQAAEELSSRYGRADLVAGNNVIAHVPDLHDFIEGVRIALKDEGLATFEFPHVLKLIQEVQFDTIYHEHFSYFALPPLIQAFGDHSLAIVSVEELPTHGGSLRIYVRHEACGAADESVARILEKEKCGGLGDSATYNGFQARVDECRSALTAFLETAQRERRSIVGYGAPAKGNTLLNFCGIDSSSIAYTVDRSPYKQGRFLPGSHLAIRRPEAIFEDRPDYVLVLPWNLLREIEAQMAPIRKWGGRFVKAIPTTEVL
jgi:SAM-dependent methyltransferase